jgi:hypothetical protein
MTQSSLSFGEQLVGVDFNPTKNREVYRVKILCAELLDIIHDNLSERGDTGFSETIVFEHAVGEIINAQMNAVKFLTFKP